MFKRLTIALIASLSLSPVAKANVVEDYIYSNPVLEVVHSSGTRILFKDPSCNRNIFGSYDSSTDVMVLCVANHPHLAELGDTIRHETFHIIQACHGGPVMGLTKLFKFAQQTDYEFISQYDNNAQHIELEANIAARTLTDSQITEHFTNACLKS